MRIRRFSLLAAVAMVLGGLTAAPPSVAAPPGAAITLDKKAPASVLLGDPVPYTLTASNPGSAPLYNVSFSDALPAGFEYVGPTSPGSAGEPTVSSDGRILTWNNVTDLQPNSSFTLEFTAKLKDPVPPVITVADSNTGYVAGSGNERKVPKFGPDGQPIADADVVSASDSTTTARDPFVVEKRNTNSPEGELLRGVHDQRSVYTLTVRNNSVVPTENVTLTDYLPAELEFLGCGNTDNSAQEEYPGSGPLGVPAIDPTPCPAPVRVDTVRNPQDVPGLGDLTGVYTAVTWNVGTLGADADREIKYVAGIPLRENTMDFGGPTPDPTGLKQGSNLDNNTMGDSTREGIPERSITNRVTATGTFTGQPQQAATVTESHTVTIEDVRMQKDTVPERKTFSPGGIVTFRFTIQASEYMTADNIRITDTLPDGYCPLSRTDTYWEGRGDCDPGAAGPTVRTNGAATPADLAYAAGTTWNGSNPMPPDVPNTYTVKLDPVAVSDNNTTVVTLPARMLDTYRATGAPTVAGDSFENKVALTAITTPIPDVGGDPEQVADDSTYTQNTALPVISKQLKKRAAPPDFPNGMECDPDLLPPYGDDTDIPEADRTFRNGDIICFKIRVDFPRAISTKGAVVTDFPPVDTEFVVGNYALTDDNTIPVDQISADRSETKLVLTLGADGPGGKYVGPGQVFEAYFAVRVLKPGTGTAPEITGNLMKMRTVNTAGVAQSYRAQAEYGLLPPPDLLIDKGVIKTDKPDATYPPVNGRLQDNKPIEQGGTATFQIDVRNRAQIPGSDYSVRGVQVWDRLPAGIDCSAIAGLQYVEPETGDLKTLPGGIATCDAGIVKWAFPSPDLANAYSIDVGQTLSLIYTMKVPDVAAAGTDYANTAGVRQYEAFTDLPGITATYTPRENIDPSLDPVADSPPLTDPSNVFIPGVEVAKDAETSVNETNNDLKNQATIGETITYTYSVTVKKGTTVYRGVLSDTLPTGIDFVSQTSAELVGTGGLPNGFTATNGTLTFPTVWSNDTTADQVFRVRVTAKVGQLAAFCGQPTCAVPPAVAAIVEKKNTATFTSFTAEQGGSEISRTADYTITIVQPNPRITKTVTPQVMTSATQRLRVRLEFRNVGATRSTLHEWQVVDCIPAPFTLPNDAQIDSNLPASSYTFQNGCLELSSTNPSGLAGGASFFFAFDIVTTASLPASQTFTNTATLTGTSMPGVVQGERTYTTSGSATFRTPGLSIGKTTTPETVTIGEPFTSRIAVDFDAFLTYYSAGVVDTLPPGVLPGSVQLVGITCKNADASNCAITGSALPASGQKIGWLFGDVVATPQKRTVTIEYTAQVADVVGNQAGGTLTNSAKPFWSQTQQQTQPGTIGDLERLPATVPAVNDAVRIIEPALTIAKTVDNVESISATPGQQFVYRVTVTNGSGQNVSDAFGIDITDTLPPHVVAAGTPDNGGVLSPDGRSVTWSIDRLPKGGSRTLSFTARLAPGAAQGTPEVNTAAIDQYFSLPNDAGRRYTGPSDPATVNPVLPVLTIRKDDSGPVAYIDQPYQWTIVVSNASGATAYGVDVVDTLPPNWSYTDDSAQVTVNGNTSQVNPTASGQALTWTDLANLPTGENLTITLLATPGPGVTQSPGIGLGTPHVNAAQSTWTTGPAGQQWPTGTTDTVTAETFIALGDLQVTKTHLTDYRPPLQAEADEVIPGTTFEWEINVASGGPDPFVGPYVLTDTLPPGNSYRGFRGGDWACTQDQVDAQKITCTHPTVSPDGLADGKALPALFIEVYVDLDAPAQMVNTATVTGKTFDRNPANNTATDSVTSRPQADLAIEKSSSGEYVVGEQIEYTLAVTNLGPSTSRKPITVTDTLPAGLSLVSYDAGPWDCSPASGPATDVTCVLDQDLPPQVDEQGGQAPLITILADVVESPGTTAKNCAVVTATTEDPVEGNNESCVKDAVVSEVQLAIAKKTTGANPVFAGESTQFTVTVANLGPAEAKNVQVQDVLESGLRATSASGPGWTCDVGTGTIVTCTRKTFPVKASPSEIVVTADVAPGVPDGTTLKNTATVTTTSPQPNGDPPPAISDVLVKGGSDLGITKSHTREPWSIGRQGRWFMTVTNNGPSDNAGPITVTDTLPRGTRYVQATGDGWQCQGSDRAFTCVRVAGLTRGQSSDLEVLVDVVSGAFPSVLNTVEVTSALPDRDPANNRAQDRVPVRRAKQTAKPLPPKPQVFPARETEQGQRIRTRIRCTPITAAAAGEASFCRVVRGKNGSVRIRIQGDRPVRVIVTQRARGTKDYEPWTRTKRYVIRP